MTKPTGNPVGRPPSGEKKMNKTLGSVAVSDDMLNDYAQVAELETTSRAVWIRDTLNKAVARLKKKHGVE